MHALKSQTDIAATAAPTDVVPANDNLPTTQPEIIKALTEDDVARLFADEYRGSLRYCHSTGAWFQWSGYHWQKNETQLPLHFVRLMARDLSTGGKKAEQNTVRKKSFAKGVEAFAQADPEFAVTIDAWDQDQFLLGTPAGTVDLRTGRLRDADPADGITKLTSVAPATQAYCPLWLRFLDESTGGDVELIRFLQQWCGYSLTGDTCEHALIFIYGGGGNGKSVFLNTVSYIMLHYATMAAMDTFTASRGDKHPTDLAMLRGARLVTASETEEGKAWAEARIKSLTGGDTISARFMRQDFFEFRPAFKLCIIGNHKPVLQNVDDAARRRFNIIPFTRKPAKPDRELEAKLREEAAGILRWMIDGCLDWQQNGLVRPKSLIEATAAYFDEQDTFAQWLADCCRAEPDNSYLFERTADLFGSWKRYAENAGELAFGGKAFAERMRKHGFSPKRRATDRGFTGIKLAGQDRYGAT
jgi:putative DNA primase/helicase